MPPQRACALCCCPELCERADSFLVWSGGVACADPVPFCSALSASRRTWPTRRSMSRRSRLRLQPSSRGVAVLSNSIRRQRSTLGLLLQAPYPTQPTAAPLNRLLPGPPNPFKISCAGVGAGVASSIAPHLCTHARARAPAQRGPRGRDPVAMHTHARVTWRG